MAKILQMPTQKYNQREFDDMFKGFIGAYDKLAEKRSEEIYRRWAEQLREAWWKKEEK